MGLQRGRWTPPSGPWRPCVSQWWRTRRSGWSSARWDFPDLKPEPRYNQCGASRDFKYSLSALYLSRCAPAGVRQTLCISCHMTGRQCPWQGFTGSLEETSKRPRGLQVQLEEASEVPGILQSQSVFDRLRESLKSSGVKMALRKLSWCLEEFQASLRVISTGPDGVWQKAGLRKIIPPMWLEGRWRFQGVLGKD